MYGSRVSTGKGRLATLLAVTLALGVMLVMGGCGGDDDGGEQPAVETDAASGGDPDYEAVVLAYMEAVEAGDVEAACELVSSDAAGNCQRSLSNAVDDPTVAEIADGATYDGVIQDDEGGALVGFTGGNGNTGVIELVNENGETKILAAVGL